MSDYHVPVLLEEAISYLKVKKGGKYIDATLGDGGHTLEILRLGGEVLGIDVDSDSIGRVGKRLEVGGWKLENEIKLVRGNFKDIDKIASDCGFTEVDGILYDLGMSRFQLEGSGRGFSFQKDEPLDMRADPKLTVRALDLVNGLTENELDALFNKLGEEKFSRRFAGAISSRRRVKRIENTSDLKEIIRKSLPRGYRRGKLDPATKVFQALRMAVNSETSNLKESLPRAVRLLKPHGRLVVISFHSLEDRIIKNYINTERPKGDIRSLTKKPITPTEEEISRNPWARSAKMRVVEVTGSEVLSSGV